MVDPQLPASLGQCTGKEGRQAESDFAALQLFLSSFFLFVVSPSLTPFLSLSVCLSLSPFSLSSLPPPTQQNYPSVILLSFLLVVR